LKYNLNGHNVRACVHRRDAEMQRCRERREDAEEFYKNFNNSLRSLCVLCVSAVNTSTHIMTVQSIVTTYELMD